MKTLLIAALAIAVPRTGHAAQCPDGAPPPCAGTRRTPPLDDRTWIILPFENIARAPEMQWLSDASVNLLYLDMSRWSDIRVIDDERVDDLLRQTQGGRQTPLRLETARAVARRVGAGRLVMGDLVSLGERTSVVAKVYETHSGRRVRSVREDIAGPGEVMPAFGRIAQGILAVPPPARLSAGAVVTTNLDAYREFIAGSRALNDWRMDTAIVRLRRAITLDSTFSLAWYRLGLAEYWHEPQDDDSLVLVHLELAARLGSALPDRERRLIQGQIALLRYNYRQSCEQFSTLVRRDSTDADAWFGLGDCLHHNQLVASGRDGRNVFRASVWAELGAMRRAFDLDQNQLAAEHFLETAGLSRGVFGCPEERAHDSNCQSRVYAPYTLEGDTLAAYPFPLSQRDAITRVEWSPAHGAALRFLRQQALDLSSRWVTLAPDSPIAQFFQADALLSTGDPGGALRAVRRSSALGGFPWWPEQLVEIHALLSLDRFADAIRIIDSLAAADTAGLVSANLAVLNRALGRYRLLPPAPGPEWARRRLAIQRLSLAGIVPDSLDNVERVIDSLRLAEGMPRDSATDLVRQETHLVTTLFGFHSRRRGPSLSTASRHPRIRIQSFLAEADTAQARLALSTFDSTLLSLPIESQERGAWLFSAESHLELGDTTIALERLLRFDLHRKYPQGVDRVEGTTVNAMSLWGRAWLLTGDLALAVRPGRRALAIQSYRRVVALWADADPELQHLVARSRAALASLGN